MIFEVRPADSVDEPLIRNAWLQSAQSGFAYRGMPRVDCDALLTKLIDDALDGSVVLVVSDKARPEEMIGWSVSAHSVDDNDRDIVTIHYVYVKHDWRKKGVGRALARALGLHEAARVIYTHNNTSAVRICPARGWRYNPTLLWRPQ